MPLGKLFNSSKLHELGMWSCRLALVLIGGKNRNIKKQRIAWVFECTAHVLSHPSECPLDLECPPNGRCLSDNIGIDESIDSSASRWGFQSLDSNSVALLNKVAMAVVIC